MFASSPSGLGRISEIWLLLSLGKKQRRRHPQEDLIRSAEVAGIVNKKEAKILEKIRRNYNDLKHKTFYKTDKVLIKNFFNDFSRIFIEDF